MQYVEMLPNVTFFQIKDVDDGFRALIKIDRRLFTVNQGDYNYVIRFIKMIENYDDRITGFNISRQFVYGSERVISTLKKIYSSKKDFVAVLESGDNPVLIGVALERKIEKHLSSIVLRTIQKS
jgi:hypothetical protein